MKPSFAVFGLICCTALAACDTPEVVRLCAAEIDGDGNLRAVSHDRSGRQVLLTGSVEAGATEYIIEDFEEGVVDDLWLRAENTYRVLPEREISPCDFPTASTGVVSFADEGQTARSTNCVGNALDRVVGLTFDAVEGREDGQGPMEGRREGLPADGVEACEWADELF